MKRFMKKMNEKKGFTLAELLIVVAIIAVLVAVAIPVFTTQLEKARQSTDLANIRSSFAEATAEALTTGAAASGSEYTVQNKNGKLDKIDLSGLTGELKTYGITASTSVTGTIQVSVDADGKVTAILKP